MVNGLRAQPSHNPNENNDKFRKRIGLNKKNICKFKIVRDQVSGGVSVPCLHTTPIAGALWKPTFGEMSDSVIMLSPVIMYVFNWYNVLSI